MVIPSFFIMSYMACLLWSATHDVLSFKIPNKISIIISLLFLPTAFMVGMSLNDIGVHLLTGFCLLAVGMVLFGFKVLGGGDVKLIAASGLWLGLNGLLPFLIYMSFAGGVLAIIILLARQTLFLEAIKKPQWLENLLDKKKGVPYGVAIAAGAIAAFMTDSLLFTHFITRL